MAGMTIMQNSFRRMCVVGETLVPSCSSDASNDWNAACSFQLSGQLRPVLSSAAVITGGYPFRTACKIFKNHTVNNLDLVFDKIGSYYHDCKVHVKSSISITQHVLISVHAFPKQLCIGTLYNTASFCCVELCSDISRSIQSRLNFRPIKSRKISQIRECNSLYLIVVDYLTIVIYTRSSDDVWRNQTLYSVSCTLITLVVPFSLWCRFWIILSCFDEAWIRVSVFHFFCWVTNLRFRHSVPIAFKIFSASPCRASPVQSLSYGFTGRL